MSANFQFHFSFLYAQDYADTWAKLGFTPQSLSPRHDLNQNTDMLKPFTEPEIWASEILTMNVTFSLEKKRH